MRSAEAFGIGRVILLDTFDIGQAYVAMGRDAKCIRISKGANRWVFVKRFTDRSEMMAYLDDKGYENVATSPHATTLVGEFLQQPVVHAKKLAVWFGNEAHGLSDDALSACTTHIALEASGITESLNLSCAFSVIMYVIAQKRRSFSTVPGRPFTSSKLR